MAQPQCCHVPVLLAEEVLCMASMSHASPTLRIKMHCRDFRVDFEVDLRFPTWVILMVFGSPEGGLNDDVGAA